jgi:hypothetical protein
MLWNTECEASSAGCKHALRCIVNLICMCLVCDMSLSIVCRSHSAGRARHMGMGFQTTTLTW